MIHLWVKIEIWKLQCIGHNDSSGAAGADARHRRMAYGLMPFGPGPTTA